MSDVSTGFSVAMVGDVMLARSVGARFREDPGAFEFAELRALLASRDIVFANLENPVAVGGAPHPLQHPNVCFRAHPDALQILTNLGVNVVSVGNNHALDYGPEALVETLVHLDERGIAHAGAGADLTAANRPVEWAIRGQRVALLAHSFVFSASTERATDRTPGVADYRIRPILARIRALHREGARVLVSVHWGIEYQFHPIPYQRRWARRMIDAGASLIIGHGPHYPQGIEDYRGGRIVYSLGNFIFDEPHKFANRSYVYTTGIGADGAVQDGAVHPVHIEGGVPLLVAGSARARLASLVRTLSERHRLSARATRRRMNNLWFTDIVWRVESMKSWKFVRLPPLYFYFSLGWRGYLRRILPSGLRRRLGRRLARES